MPNNNKKFSPAPEKRPYWSSRFPFRDGYYWCTWVEATNPTERKMEVCLVSHTSNGKDVTKGLYANFIFGNKMGIKLTRMAANYLDLQWSPQIRVPQNLPEIPADLPEKIKAAAEAKEAAQSAAIAQQVELQDASVDNSDTPADTQPLENNTEA